MPGEIKINIVLEKQGFQNEKKQINSYPSLIRQTVQTNQFNEIMLNQIILKLKRKGFRQIFDSFVSYYHQGKQLFVFGFFIPIDINDKQLQAPYSRYTKKIPHEALENLNNGELSCKLRLRKKVKSKVQMLIVQQEEKFGDEALDHDDNKKVTKQKQKTIAQVIEKVALWRKLYTGFPSETGGVVHYELEQAAQKIGVIKKTLDDYLLQIRNGKRHGYNFHKNKNEKIGKLRSFVREKKDKQTAQKEIKF